MKWWQGGDFQEWTHRVVGCLPAKANPEEVLWFVPLAHGHHRVVGLQEEEIASVIPRVLCFQYAPKTKQVNPRASFITIKENGKTMNIVVRKKEKHKLRRKKPLPTALFSLDLEQIPTELPQRPLFFSRIRPLISFPSLHCYQDAPQVFGTRAYVYWGLGSPMSLSCFLRHKPQKMPMFPSTPKIYPEKHWIWGKTLNPKNERKHIFYQIFAHITRPCI